MKKINKVVGKVVGLPISYAGTFFLIVSVVVFSCMTRFGAWLADDLEEEEG